MKQHPESSIRDWLHAIAAFAIVALGLAAAVPRAMPRPAQGEACRYESFRGTCRLVRVDASPPGDASNTVVVEATWFHVLQGQSTGSCPGTWRFTVPAADVPRLRSRLDARPTLPCHGTEIVQGSCVPCTSPVVIDAPPPRGFALSPAGE